MSDDGSRFVFERSDGDRPNEVYTAGRDFSDAHALTNLNPQLAGVALTHSELVSYLDVDGKKLYGVLYYPYGYQPGKKYPLVAEIYETFFDNGFNESMNLLAARGWFVFHPSVDLHIGYPGEAWVKGVTDGINSLEEKGLVDGTKLGVEGTSYGGYATNLLITQTDRFAAAVNISGKVDIISFLGDSPKIGTRNYNAAEEGQDRIGATLWEAPHEIHPALGDHVRRPDQDAAAHAHREGRLERAVHQRAGDVLRVAATGEGGGVGAVRARGAWSGQGRHRGGLQGPLERGCSTGSGRTSTRRRRKTRTRMAGNETSAALGLTFRCGFSRPQERSRWIRECPRRNRCLAPDLRSIDVWECTAGPSGSAVRFSFSPIPR